MVGHAIDTELGDGSGAALSVAGIGATPSSLRGLARPETGMPSAVDVLEYVCCRPRDLTAISFQSLHRRAIPKVVSSQNRSRNYEEPSQAWSCAGPFVGLRRDPGRARNAPNRSRAAPWTPTRPSPHRVPRAERSAQVSRSSSIPAVASGSRIRVTARYWDRRPRLVSGSPRFLFNAEVFQPRAWRENPHMCRRPNSRFPLVGSRCSPTGKREGG